MDSKLLIKILDLKELIENCSIYKDLILAESLMENDDSVMLLSYKKDMALVSYEDALKHYDKNSQEVLNLSENLSKAVYNLNNHQLVMNYKSNLNSLNNLYQEIENLILKGIK